MIKTTPRSKLGNLEGVLGISSMQANHIKRVIGTSRVFASSDRSTIMEVLVYELAKILTPDNILTYYYSNQKYIYSWVGHHDPDKPTIALSCKKYGSGLYYYTNVLSHNRIIEQIM